MMKGVQVRVLVAILVAAALAAYGNSGAIPLIFDDQNAIVENPTIRTLSLPVVLAGGPAQSSTAGRPLVNLSLAINYALGGVSPAGYHAFNLFVHILCGLLLFGIVRRTLERRPAAPSPPTLTAFFCALLWLLHPMQTETVDYITQRSESMMAFAYLATFYAFVRSLGTAAPLPWQGVAIAACALGALCKESIVTAPVALLLFDVAFFSSSPRQALRSRPLLYGGLLLSWVVLAALNVSGPRSHSAGFSSGVDVWTYLLNQGGILLRYFQRAILPVRLIFDYGVPRPLSFADALPAVAAVGLLFAAALAAWRIDRRIGFLATWVFVTLSPTSSIVPIATEAGAERRMYLALAAFAIGLVVAMQRLWQRPRGATAALTMVALVFAVLTFRRNEDYRSPTYLWQTVIDRYPHGRAHYGLAMELKAAGRSTESMREMEIAARDFPEAEYALGFELANAGHHQEAVQYLRRYVVAKPDDLNVVRAYTLLGRSLNALGQPEAAAAAFRDALRRRPGNLDAMGGLGDALVRLRRFDEAIGVYQVFLQQRADAGAYFNYGLSLAARGRDRDAAAAFRASIDLVPNNAAAHANLAGALARLGDVNGAIAEYERVAALDSDPEIRRAVEEMVKELRGRR